MHELAVRNQDDGLTPTEKEEMHAFGRAATLLSIFKSKARRTLGVNLKTRTSLNIAHGCGTHPACLAAGRWPL